MKDNKFIIVLSIIAVMFGGLFCYRYFGGKNETATHREDNHARLVTMAKSNPRSGLAQMARALKKHFADKKFFPLNLKALYPEYIADRAFLEEIEWKYMRRGNSFQLSKTVSKNGKQLTASIDESLRFGSGEKMLLAQTENEQFQPYIPDLHKQVVKKETRRLAASQTLQKIDPMAFDDFGMNAFTNASIEDRLEEIMENDASPAEPEQLRAPAPPLAENMGSKKDQKVANLGGRYLIWKDHDGHLGFSNVQYPEESDVEHVYVEGRWRRFRN